MNRDVFQALADPTRRAILLLLATQAMTPNALAEEFDISRQGVSKHLKILKECEVLESRKAGREMIYHFNPEKLKPVDDWLAPFRQLWEQRFQQLDQLLSDQNSDDHEK
ncbi:MAG: winged helix-turn-helix transcriptional regulator [Phaeodactylibacter sp.]|nr:winged helix-turn-helix transcriptional regulator [Phaeodactylibacter sp.]